ncbi:MAG: Spy/CpxP family protein refolding chaperone [Methylovirgula sp.]
MTKIPGSAADETETPMFSAQDHAAFLDARMAALHAGLTLTPDQQKLWPPVEQALRDFHNLVWTQHKKMREEKDKRDPIARLQLRSANMIARGEALKKVAGAAGPLYATFTEAQKHRLPILLRATMHPFGHRRFMMGRGMMGPGMMYRWRHGMMGHGRDPRMMEHGMMRHENMGGNEGQNKD